MFFIACLAVAGTSLLVWRTWQTVRFGRLRRYFWPGLVLHVLAGWGVGLLYRYAYGGGDTWFFFERADALTRLAYTDIFRYLDLLFAPERTTFESGSERTYYAVHWFSLWHLLGGRSYWLTAAYLSLLSFSGLWACMEALAFRFPRQRRYLAMAFLFSPSVLFWSSGWLKESILWFFLGWGIALFLNLQAGRRSCWWQWGIAMVGLFLIWKIKYYYLAALLPALFTYGLTVALNRRYPMPMRKVILLQLMLYVGLLFLATRLHWNLHPEHLLEAIFNSHHLVRTQTPPHNLLLRLPETPSLAALLTSVPEALVASLFRPFVWESGSALKTLAGLETLALTLLWIGGLYRRGREVAQAGLPTPASWLPALVAVMLYLLVLAILLPLAAPNLGSLVRFRVSFWPFWVWLSLAFFGSPNKSAGSSKEASD